MRRSYAEFEAALAEETVEERQRSERLRREAAAQLATTNHALAYGFSRGFLVSAGIMLLGLIIGLVLIRVKREDLEGINPMAAPADEIPESADAIPATAD